MDDGQGTPPSSAFVDRLRSAVERWAALVPPHRRQEFRDEFARIGEDHERTISTIQNIWQRGDQRLALDESTGLARRRPFLDHLATVLSPGGSAFAAVAVLFLDIDNLKALNDTFGHEAGDRALAAVGRLIREIIRAERPADFAVRAPATSGDHSISRHGGDEFLIALELDNTTSIDAIAPRIKRHVDNPARQQAHGHHAPSALSVSIGGVVYEIPETTPVLEPYPLARNLIAAADEQMYRSKRDHRIHIVEARFTDRLEIDRDHARTLAAS